MRQLKALLLIGILNSAPAYAGIISHTDYTSGSVITAAGQNSNENTIFNEFNGNIDNTNIKTGGVVGTNLANNTVTATQLGSGAATLAKLDQTGLYGQVIVSSNSTQAPIWGGSALLQQVQCSTTTDFSTTGNTYHETYLSCPIVLASTNSKVMVTVDGTLQNPGSADAYLTVYRGSQLTLPGSTSIAMADCYNATNGGECPVSVHWLDSPLLQGSTTYIVNIRSAVSGQIVHFPVSGNIGVVILQEYGR